jgi:hypothetical protein
MLLPPRLDERQAASTVSEDRQEHKYVVLIVCIRRLPAYPVVITVQLLAGCWGAAELPKDLQSFETFARSLNFEIPIPEWWYDFIHVLKEVEDKMVAKIVRVRKCHFSLANSFSLGVVAGSVYTQFHMSVNMPSNWIAVGDSVMRVNPIFACVPSFVQYRL